MCTAAKVNTTAMSMMYAIQKIQICQDDEGLCGFTCTLKSAKFSLAPGWHLAHVSTTFCWETELSGTEAGRM